MKNSLKQFIANTRKNVGVLENVQFFKAAGHNDWRNFVPQEIIEVWEDLSFEAKCVGYFFAKTQANLQERD